MVLLYVGSTDSPAIGAMAQHNLCPLCCLPEVTEQHCWHCVWAPNPQDQQEAQISTLWGISTHIKQKGFFVCAYGIRQENFLSDGKWQFNFKRIKTRVLKQVSWQKMVLFRGTLPSDHWIVDKHEVFVQGLSLCCAESAFLPAKHLDSVTTLFFLSFLHAPHSLCLPITLRPQHEPSSGTRCTICCMEEEASCIVLLIKVTGKALGWPSGTQETLLPTLALSFQGNVTAKLVSTKDCLSCTHDGKTCQLLCHST